MVNPPHLPTSQQQPPTIQVYEASSLSEGTYAKDLTRQTTTLKQPRIRDNLRFSGESKCVGQFFLDIHDTLEQFSSEFANDKRRINWIAAHFTSTNNDVSPAQAWLVALLMKDADIHGIVDPYANLESLEYILPPPPPCVLQTPSYKNSSMCLETRPPQRRLDKTSPSVDKGMVQSWIITPATPHWLYTSHNQKKTLF